jgi:hypothetical protein
MNITLKAKVRHWFNFYRLALKSSNPLVQANLTKSQDFYLAWGDVEKISYDDWWKSHSKLFHTRELFEVLEGSFKTNSDSLYLKVPFSSPPVSAAKIFTRIYREELLKYRGIHTKIKKQYKGNYQLTPLEFQATNFRYYWTFAEKVYVPLLEKLGTEPKTRVMVELAKEKFRTKIEHTKSRSREVKKQRIAPFSQDIEEEYESLSRTATRYRSIVKALLLNVSKGIFPGDYQEEGLKTSIAKRKFERANFELKKVGRKRIPRQKGYSKIKRVEDQDNPNKRKMYVK